MSTKDVLSPNEAADYIGVGTDWLYKRRRNGDGPKYIRIGGLIRYKRSDIDAYLNANKIEQE